MRGLLSTDVVCMSVRGSYGEDVPIRPALDDPTKFALSIAKGNRRDGTSWNCFGIIRLTYGQTVL